MKANTKPTLGLTAAARTAGYPDSRSTSAISLPSARRTVYGGKEISARDEVAVWEGSANRDELVLDEPEAFDTRRSPNPHLGFGKGIHFCMGANLARLELHVMFEELLPRFEKIRLVEPIEWTRSNRHTGIRRMLIAAH